ncbi:MAG: septal ring lytic transglycosylase RlpA family protein [Gammaproteobacteria bacterium]|nr:septal ring lytic transglycosylase RlpA family protein [Gammaproteobacteria bacterium]
MTLTLKSMGCCLVTVLGTGVVGCASHPSVDGGPRRAINVALIPDAVPRVEPRSDKGNPVSYQVNGQTYYIKTSAEGYVERGIASWYGSKFHGRATSSGEPYDMYKMTAAHPTLPIPCYVQVTNLQNHRQVVVRVNDRGPFHPNRIIDLSYTAAKKLGIADGGTGLVEVRSIDPRHRQPTRRIITPNPNPKVVANNAPVHMFIQAGAFTNRSNAQQLQQQLHALLEGQHVVADYDQTDKLYRVRIGPLPSVEEADKLTQLINANGFAAPHVVID